jgi:DinB superfamily
MLETELNVNRFMIWYFRKLVDDVPDERMAEQPFPGVNHPAWIVGHLAWSTDRARWLLGLEPELPAEWTTMFGFGSKPSPTRGDYPARDELIQAVEQGFERLRDQVASATPEQLGQPSPNARTKEFLPTVKDGIVLLLTGHLGTHLGQLTTWRRMIGMPPLF